MNTASEARQHDSRLCIAAEVLLTSVHANYSPVHPAEKRLHQPQVHQIRLEMENEALRQAQIALEEARDRYRHLYEYAPVGYLTLNPDGLIAEINLTGASLFGVGRKKLLQKPFVAWIVPDDQARWATYHGGLKESGGSGGSSGQNMLNIALRRSDGAVVHAQLNCLRQDDCFDNGALRVTLTDVTQHRRAESENEHSLRRIEALMRHANDCILMFDAEMRIIDASDSCLKIYGYSSDELLTMTLSDLRAPDVRHEIPDIVKQLQERGSMSYQTWHCRKDGSRFPIQVGAAMIELDGTPYVQGIVRDVSESLRDRAIMESGLAAASRRLHELSRHLVEAQEDARRRLSGELHDRTSPNLAAIRINLGMAASALPTSASTEFSERLADTLALVEDTDVSIREICADLRSPVLDYAGLLAAMEGYAMRYASRTGIKVELDFVDCDKRLDPALESLLFRIFQEALTNSLKHARANSIKVVANLEARPVTLMVSDDGVGFDPATVEIEATSGMGLLSMREMAEFAGGQMVIDSRPGAGTRIDVRIRP